MRSWSFCSSCIAARSAPISNAARSREYCIAQLFFVTILQGLVDRFLDLFDSQPFEIIHRVVGKSTTACLFAGDCQNEGVHSVDLRDAIIHLGELVIIVEVVITIENLENGTISERITIDTVFVATSPLTEVAGPKLGQGGRGFNKSAILSVPVPIHPTSNAWCIK